MSADPPPLLPENRVVVGCGSISADFLATVASFPKPDDKIRSTSLKVLGGGNAGNALTCAARLGLNPSLISKVAYDSQGRRILEELEADGVSKEGHSPFTYIIVDNQTKTRTCIHTPGSPPLVPADISESTMLSALDGARIIYFDGRLHEAASVIGKEVIICRKIPILVDAERKMEGLNDLLQVADYAVCSANFPRASWFCSENLRGVWTEAPSISGAIVSMLLRLPKLKFVIVTLGENGCIMLQRSVNEASESEETDIDSLLESLKQRKDSSITSPTCFPSAATRLKANGIGMVSARLFLGTAEKIPPEELVDTTGAGDAFIGAVLYAICAGMPPEKMLPFAAQVAACSCRALGARTSLPRPTDPRLAPFLL